MRMDKAIGVIAVRRAEVRQFTDRQIDLLETFANQAVIAIENTRLFEAEQASNGDFPVRGMDDHELRSAWQNPYKELTSAHI